MKIEIIIGVSDSPHFVFFILGVRCKVSVVKTR
jgi:hypothetical protein